MKKRIPFAFLALFAGALGLGGADTCSGEEAGQPFVRLYDTGALAADRLPDAAVATMTGWKQVPAGDTTHKFSGDLALGNERLVAILRMNGRCAEVYSLVGGGAKHRADLVPVIEPGFAVGRATDVRIVENTPGAVTVEVDFIGPAKTVFRLAVGQPYVEVRPAAGTVGLFVYLWPRWMVVPDFFGDDLAFEPDTLGDSRYRLPAENFVLDLGWRCDTMTMCVWQDRGAWVWAELMKINGRPVFVGWRIGCAEGKSLWVAFLEGKDIWHERLVPAADTGKASDWKPPFPAKWRADLVRDNGFAESLTFESPPALAAGRYVIYPLDRTRATPLTEFTPVDILRNTLGVGPCQYILETEGLASADNPTPDNVLTWVEKQVKKKGGKDAADDIRERLKAMVELIGRTEARIKRYADFAAETKQLLASDNSEAGPKLKATADTLAKAAADGLAATQPPGRVVKLSETIAALIGKDTAAADLAAPAAELRAVGAAQDRALAKSRMAVRWLGCQAQASETGKRTEAFLQGK